jgi:hypothetical protein
MLEIKNNKTEYPQTISDYAKFVAGTDTNLEEEIKKIEEEDYFKNIDINDAQKAAKIAKMFFEYTSNIVSLKNKYLYESFLHILSIPNKKHSKTSYHKHRTYFIFKFNDNIFSTN